MEPIAKPAPLDRLWVPGRCFVCRQQPFLDLGRADVPRRLRVVHQRRVATPAVWVGVVVVASTEQQTAGQEVGDQVLVGSLEELPANECDVGIEGAIGSDRVDHWQAVFAAYREVIGAECWCEVNQASAVFGCDVLPEGHEVRVGDINEIEWSGIWQTFEVSAGQVGTDCPGITKYLFDESSGNDVEGALELNDVVRRVGLGCYRCVGNQRPRRRCPDQQR